MVRGGRSASVVVVGSLNYDVLVRVQRFPAPGETVLGTSSEFGVGGKGANQAVAASRAGSSVALIGAVGNDPRGVEVLAGLRAANVNVERVRVASVVPTGTAHVMIDRSGENVIAVAPGANGTLAPDDLNNASAMIADARVVVMQAEIPALTMRAVFRRARESALSRVVVNLAPVVGVDHAWLADVDYLVVNEVELAQLLNLPSVPPTDEVPQLLAEHALARRVVVTLGGAGAVARLADGQVLTFPVTRQVPVVDTTGAGDAFVGVLAAAIDQGLSDREALEWAVWSASDVVSRVGAALSYPTFARPMVTLDVQPDPNAANVRA